MMPGRGYHKLNAGNYNSKTGSAEPHRYEFAKGYCTFCGLHKFLLPNETVCAACDEDENYQRMKHMNEAIDNLLKLSTGYKDRDLDGDWP
jgi:hypothetical protein